MKSISVMKVRRHLGSLLDEVRLNSETFILERSGKAIAMLTPVRDTANPSTDVARRLRAIKDLADLNAKTKRSENIDGWLQRERDNWGDRP